ncbi:phage tail assembly protein [Candidatus Fukatsuia symbiotica]|uniref:Phage tail protein n=1 Tax=Candidatus Fukatsuia symbiotica TaxID=1878942 RepID=A0A2U8I6H2_9GAMM|nr:phage tail assembly protein [Candidatus Fukatsuia symbiotica]AWK14760.1 phage tail protein [Candidatus Fukatsuia symbiotica]MEA9445094.1 phage tail assembly protein [Candidatus Fukatsuia symbiotica]
MSKPTATQNNDVIITPSEENKTSASVTLDTPLVRGESTLNDITVRKPLAGALRGAKIQALLETDVDALMIVLPRVTTPALTKSDIMALNPADLYRLSVELIYFLLPKSVKSSFQPD